jgi:hypothetical protein
MDHLVELKGLGQSSAWVSHMSLPTEAYVALRFEDMTKAALVLEGSNPDEPTGSVGHGRTVLGQNGPIPGCDRSPDAAGAINSAKEQATVSLPALWLGYCEASRPCRMGQRLWPLHLARHRDVSMADLRGGVNRCMAWRPR